MFAKFSEISESELSGAGGAQTSDSAPPPRITLTKKKFIGKYAIPADDFNPDMVREFLIHHFEGPLL